MSRRNIFTAASRGSTARWGLASIFLLLLVRFAVPAHAAFPCTTPLFGFGPVDPVHGFPQYYQDSTGLALQPCLDAVCGGAGFALPDPALPLSFPGNFPGEVFYSRAIAKMTVGTISVVYTNALEGSFVTGVAVSGDQGVFSPVRGPIFRVPPRRTYTVTHPPRGGGLPAHCPRTGQLPPDH